MVVARNAGEAKEARKATKQFKEMRAFNDHKLRIGKVHNNQKHVSEWRFSQERSEEHVY